MMLFAMLLQACGSPSGGFFEPQPTVDAAGPDTRVDLAATFAALDRHFDPRGPRAAPLTAARIAELERELPCPLTPLVRDMYAWRNGVDAFVPGYDWLPLERVVEESKQLRRYADELPGDGWLRTRLPLLMLDGQEYLVLECGAGKKPTIARYFMEGGDRTLRYRGVGHLLATTLSAYDNAGYRYERGYLEASPLLVARAFARHSLDSEKQAVEANWRQLEPMLHEARGTGLMMLVQSMERFADERAVPILASRLATASAEDATRLLFVLGDFRARETLPQIDAMLDHASPQVRNIAAMAIGQIGAPLPPATLDKLLALLDDANDLVQLSAIGALGASGSPRALEPLLQRLPMSRRGLQFAIVDALAALRDKSALPALRELQTNLAGADLNEPLKGGTRGADLTPRQLKAAVDRAIADLGG
jgi:hypothetical protein